MWVVNPFNIFVHECNGLLVRYPRPWGSSWKLDVLHYLQVRLPWLGRLSCQGPSYDNFYFFKRESWWLFELSLQLLVLVISSKEISQFSLPYEILYLLLQIKTLIRITHMVSVKATILVPIALIGISLHFFRPLQGRIVLDLHSSNSMFKGVYCWLRVEKPTFLLSQSFFSPVRTFFGREPFLEWHGRFTSIRSALFLFLAIITSSAFIKFWAEWMSLAMI